MYESYKEMSRAGVKKQQEAQKAKALWAMKAAKDRREDFYHPAGTNNILIRNRTRLELWEEHLKDPIFCAGQSLHMMIEENSGRSENGSSVSSSSSDENNLGNDALFVISMDLATQLPSS